MAFWQCEYALVPKSVVTETNISLVVNDFAASNDSDTSTSGITYWQESPRTIMNSSVVESVLPRLESWSDHAWMFGTKGFDEVEIWDNMIFFRINTRQINLKVIDLLVFLARSLNCVLISKWTKGVLDPEVKCVLSDIKTSHGVMPP